MIPKLNGIDHIHIYVSSREKAAEWYEKVLNFKINKTLSVWAKDKQGPLTVEDQTGEIHLALFKGNNFSPSKAVAFNADGMEFLKWKSYLEQQGVLLRCSDHAIAWSLYFEDPDKNMYEITSYQYDYIADHIC